MKQNSLLVRQSFIWYHHSYPLNCADILHLVLFFLMLLNVTSTPSLFCLFFFITFILCQLDLPHLTLFTSLLTSLLHLNYPYYCSSPYSISLLIHNLSFASPSCPILLCLIISYLILFSLQVFSAYFTSSSLFNPFLSVIFSTTSFYRWLQSWRMDSRRGRRWKKRRKEGNKIKNWF